MLVAIYAASIVVKAYPCMPECVSSKNNTSVNDVIYASCAGFLCTNRTCLPMMKRCDVTFQCQDGEDEIDCSTVDRAIRYIIYSESPGRGGATEHESVWMALTSGSSVIRPPSLDVC
ncbi:hypothetical protein DPMN_046972 [Dreissena polymorpha]|uniref:Uncharacterized protein n=1 Tax=Dreissena polymorpha TaxID=45954 RepID=A0A9D4D8Q7_DREPO|nr:hypothetical protein DPMN_046972 [Dreissena polymorpha]